MTRPVGRALLVASPACRAQPLASLQALGFGCAERDDPYGAMAELCRRPLVYRALILSLSGLYREELALIRSVKRRFPHVEVWLTHTDGRQATLAEAMRLGADGLLAEDGLHRIGVAPEQSPGRPAPFEPPPAAGHAHAEDAEAAAPQPTGADPGAAAPGEPVLTADELRALLEEQPPDADGE